MQQKAGRVLVIDDDEIVAVAVADMLEDHNYQVFTRTTPIGATQVIVREQIDVAVIDVNMPEMQGDSVVRLFSSWDRLKDLPVIMLTGTESHTLERLQHELPNVPIVRKTAMQTDLVRTLDKVLTAARSSRHRYQDLAATTGEFKNEALKSARDINQAYLEDLAEQLEQVQLSWKLLMRSDRRGYSSAITTLDGLQRRAQLLNLEHVAALLHGLSVVFESSYLAPRLEQSDRIVADAINALSALRTRRAGDFSAPPTFLKRDLMQLASELRARVR